MNIFTEINWLAVVIGTVVYCAFCGIWHRQFAFGKKWEEAMDFKRPENWKETSIYYVVPSISCFVTTVAISVLLKLTRANSYTDALIVGLIAGIGFAMAVVFTAAVTPIMKKPLTFGAITGTAQALGITLVTIIIYAISK
jgi:Na+-transporting NADH:ubiquinone oxidoreductase subunit NqrE